MLCTSVHLMWLYFQVMPYNLWNAFDVNLRIALLAYSCNVVLYICY
jgi:hypothetical protein